MIACRPWLVARYRLEGEVRSTFARGMRELFTLEGRSHSIRPHGSR